MKTDLHMVKKEMKHLYELVEFLLVSDLQTSADIEKKNLRQVMILMLGAKTRQIKLSCSNEFSMI